MKMTKEPDSQAQFNSSPCMMHDTDPSYHGFLSGDETVALLLSLLHAERAGTKVCLLSEKEAPSVQHKQLLRDICQDEQKSCQGLLESLTIMGAIPDKKVGEFATKCLAINDFDERLQFLNRGQGWVVREIEKNLAAISDTGVQKQLRVMLEEHRQNIDKLNQFLNSHTA